MNIDFTLAFALQGRLAGETIVSHDNLVWITKTHWPMEYPYKSEKFAAQKCISIVRNPIDAIVSNINYFLTMSHTDVPDVPPNELDPDWWSNAVT